MSGMGYFSRCQSVAEKTRKPDTSDVRDLIACATDAFCEQFGISGPADRRCVFARIALEANQMANEIPGVN